MDESNANESIQTEETVTEPQDIYEAQGARPRIPATVKYDIGFLQSLQPVIVEDGCLHVSVQDLFVMQGDFQAKIKLQDIRIVSKFEYKHGKQCIHVSFYNNEKNCISNIFFEVKELDRCFSALQEFQKKKLMEHISPEELEFAFNILSKQPIFQGWVRSTIQEKEEDQPAKLEAPAEEAPEYLLIVDLECISWYESKTIVPTFQMNFWADDTPTSVETVRHHHGQNFILFETKKRAVVINAVKQIVDNMRSLRPKKVNFLKDNRAFLEFARQIHFDSPLYPREPRPLYQSESATQMTRPSVSAEQTVDAREIEVETFVAAMDTAEDQFKSEEYFQNIWITHEYDLKEIMAGDRVPSIDAISGGLDPDSPDHFKKALTDIDECLAENDYTTCLAKVVAVREIFRASHINAITTFLNTFNDVEILKKLYFRSLVK